MDCAHDRLAIDRARVVRSFVPGKIMPVKGYRFRCVECGGEGFMDIASANATHETLVNDPTIAVRVKEA